jgi:O-antigen/teichoic acid export membrane protein
VARLFQEKLRQGQAALAEVLGAGVMLGLVWSLADHGAGVVAMVGAMVAGQVTTLAVSWLFANRLVPFRLRFDLDVWRRLTLAGLPIGGSMILNGITFHGDTLLLSIFQPAADVGVYGLAFKILETVIVIVTMFTGLMMPFLSRYASVDRDRFQAYLSGAFDTLTTGAVGVVVIVFHFAGDLVRLLGGTEFDTAAPALRILGLAMLLVSMASIFRAAVTALDRQKQMFWGDAVAAALALIVYSLLIPRFSFIGAAWGKVLAELATLVFAVAIVGRTVGWLPSPKTAAKALAAGALTLGAIKLLQLAGVPWVANLLVGCIVYVTVLLLGGAISREFLRTLLGDRVAEP